MIFFWWNDAVAFARELAEGTRIRHRVTWTSNGWLVEPVLELVPPA